MGQVGPANLTSDATNPASFNDKDAPIAPEGVCMPVERFHPAWSLSGKCMDKDEVLSKTTRINGLNGWIAAFFSLFAVFIAGQVVDTVGRRPVLICFLSSNIVVKVLLLVSCYLPYGPFFAILVLQNVIEVAFASGVEPALNSMIADRSRGNEDLRGDGFAALGMVMHAADVLAFLAGYPVLKLHLENYTVFWGPLIVVSIVAYIIFNCIPCSTLPETLHEVVDMSEAAEEDEEEEDSVQESFCGTAERCFRALCSETILGFKMVLSDPYLAQFLVIWALILVSMSGSWNLATQYLLGLGYEQANASLARPAWQLSLVLGAAISPHFIRNCSATGAFILALVMMAVGFFWCGTGGHDLEHAELFFWGGTIVLGGVGFGILSPCFSAIISVRVSDKDLVAQRLLHGRGFPLNLRGNLRVATSVSQGSPP
ncbi:unnamed protein product [Effrenium voratum]|uniref:Uncharacterized protein n=1 Tax=Effrenium voratum TaxID=2562239 RepID=A0AA36IRP9_9DINO|nr:unnamed protein product [Effrenium voratum]